MVPMVPMVPMDPMDPMDLLDPLALLDPQDHLDLQVLAEPVEQGAVGVTEADMEEVAERAVQEELVVVEDLVELVVLEVRHHFLTALHNFAHNSTL